MVERLLGLLLEQDERIGFDHKVVVVRIMVRCRERERVELTFAIFVDGLAGVRLTMIAARKDCQQGEGDDGGGPSSEVFLILHIGSSDIRRS